MDVNSSIFPLQYRLSDPRFTIYHRASLGGLAATIRAWGKKQPEGICATYDATSVRIEKVADISDREALQSIIDASFKLDENKLIELPGQFIGKDREDLQLVSHEAFCSTFLQHNSARPGEKEPRLFQLKSADGEEVHHLTYKALNSYAHQKAQGTRLLEDKKNGKAAKPTVATIPQSLVPGAFSGRKSLEAPPAEVFLLLFLMVGSVAFTLRPRTYKEKAQYCLIIPDISDLVGFSRAMEQITSSAQSIEIFSNTYLGRVVGGLEEAALVFSVDLATASLEKRKCIDGCQAIAMGKVPWDKNQINRSLSIKVGVDFYEIEIFRIAKKYLGTSKFIKLSDGKSFSLPDTNVPELIAANLARERHWCSHFKELVAEKKDFQNLLYRQKGFAEMVKAIKDTDDRLIIQAFHRAWEVTMAQLGDRARDGGLDFSRLVEVRREKVRNEILRAKTADALAGWFLRFCADATKGASLAPMRDDADRLRAFIFNQRNYERFQNLLLFALLSYAGKDKQEAAPEN